MPHNQESARATVLAPQSDKTESAMRNPIGHVQIVGGVTGGLVLLVLLGLAAVLT